MSADHYFSAAPTSAGARRSMEVELAGRPVRVHTAAGVFSPDRIDRGTQVLLREAPAPSAHGTFLDLGCGWGPLAVTLGLLSPAATVYAIDVNERALALARDNAAALGLDRVLVRRPDDVPHDVRFDLVWSNPPIRVGKAVLHEMLSSWLPRLNGAGEAYLVVQKNLGADSLQRWIDTTLGLSCERHAVSKGFRVLRINPAD